MKIGVKAPVHFKVMKRKVLQHVKKLGLCLNHRNSKTLGVQSVGFIAGVHGKLANEEWCEKMLKKVLEKEDIEVEVVGGILLTISFLGGDFLTFSPFLLSL